MKSGKRGEENGGNESRGGMLERRAITPTPGSVTIEASPPRRQVNHRVVLVKSEQTHMARRRRIEDHYGRQAFPVTETEQIQSNYRDEFFPKAITRSPACYPKNHLNIDHAAKSDFISRSRDGFYQPSPIRPPVGNHQQPHLQSSSLLSDLMGAKFESRTEKQDQFSNYKIVLG